jgi:inner membrane protein
LEPVTHALASLALGQTGLNRVSRLATPMLLVSGLAADLDWLGYLAGPRFFLAAHRTATHSLLGTALIACATAALFSSFASLRLPTGIATPIPGHDAHTSPARHATQFFPALIVCSAGAVVHLLLDLSTSYGVKLLWPFSGKWYAWDFAPSLDPLMLFLLLAGILLPRLFGLVTQEISGRAKVHQGGRSTTTVLLLVLLYLGGRAVAHQNALALLNSRVYRGETPLRSAAFPVASPLNWTGLVETPDAIDEVQVPLSGAFDPETARPRYKPADSPALEAARRSAAAQAFLAFARFPFATQEETPSGYRIEIRDLRFAAAPPANNFAEVVAIVTVSPQSLVLTNELQFAAATAPPVR